MRISRAIRGRRRIARVAKSPPSMTRGTSWTKSRMRRGDAPTRACSLTILFRNGTLASRQDGLTPAIRAVNICSLTIPLATSPASISSNSWLQMIRLTLRGSVQPCKSLLRPWKSSLGSLPIRQRKSRSVHTRIGPSASGSPISARF